MLLINFHVSSITFVSVADLESSIQQSNQPLYSTDNTAALATIAMLQTQIYNNIGTSELLVSSVFAFNNLTGSNVMTTPGLTNMQCALFRSNYSSNTAAANAQLNALLQSILPVAVNGSIVNSVSCGPLNVQLNGDQDASVFSLNITLTALSAVFPVGLTSTLVFGACNVVLTQVVLAASATSLGL